ncbi:acetyltransferase [Aphelenchoides avenae]|nr:acetyltransferase [Aphelenchus avenae]
MDKVLDAVETEEDLLIVKATQADADEIHRFLLGDFLTQEPLNVALGVTAEESSEFFEDIVQSALAHPVSYIVRHKPSNKLIAVRLTSILRRPEALDVVEDSPFNADSKSDKIGDIQRLLHSLESKTWQLVPEDVSCVLCWMVVSVDKSFGRRGIARRLVTHNLDEARSLGCQGIIAEASAYNSQKLFEKLGYESLFEILHEQWKSASGERIFYCKDQTEKEQFGNAQMASSKKCFICGKELNHLSDIRQTMHINTCLDKEETSSLHEKETTKWQSTYDCPLCGEALGPGPYRAAHAKKCGQKNKIPSSKLLDLMDTQSRVADNRKKNGLTHTKAKAPELKPKKPKLDRDLPRSALDEQLLVAKALSMSELDLRYSAQSSIFKQ